MKTPHTSPYDIFTELNTIHLKTRLHVFMAEPFHHTEKFMHHFVHFPKIQVDIRYLATFDTLWPHLEIITFLHRSGAKLPTEPVNIVSPPLKIFFSILFSNKRNCVSAVLFIHCVKIFSGTKLDSTINMKSHIKGQIGHLYVKVGFVKQSFVWTYNLM